jgi:uncharacterized membrane protein YhaH (DUF805 family)
MIDTFKKCVTVNYANFTGRANRREYWYFQIIACLIYIVLSIIAFLVFSYNQELVVIIAVIVIIGIAALGMIVPMLALTVRRLHDFNWSGWFILLELIPYVGGVFPIIFGCIQGTPGPNNFGYPPDFDPLSMPPNPYGYQPPIPYQPGGPPYPGQPYPGGQYGQPDPGAGQYGQPYPGQPQQPGGQPYPGQPQQPGGQPYPGQPQQPGGQPTPGGSSGSWDPTKKP